MSVRPVAPPAPACALGAGPSASLRLRCCLVVRRGARALSPLRARPHRPAGRCFRCAALRSKNGLARPRRLRVAAFLPAVPAGFRRASVARSVAVDRTPAPAAAGAAPFSQGGKIGEGESVQANFVTYINWIL